MVSKFRAHFRGNLIGYVALFVVLGGTAYASVPRNSVKSKSIKNGQVKSVDLKDGAVTTQKIAAGAVNDSKISDYEVIGNSPVRVVATEGASEAAARTAAPEVPLFSKGQLSIYAKCFRDTSTPVGIGTVVGELYGRTSANGALMQGNDSYPNAAGTLLNTTTPEVDRQFDTQSVNTANAGSIGEEEASLTAPDGTDLHLLTHTTVKQGTLPAGDGVLLGAGNVCLFGGAILG